jgi:DNA-binding IclR family transcriptional regulator
MPRKAAQLSEADKHAAEGGAVAVDRALFVLSAFREGDGTLGLAELAQRSGLYKSTLLRLLASLEHARLIQRHTDGRYGLGPEIARLNAVYAASFSLEQVVLPALRELVRTTRESAAFHIQQGEHRLCLYRVDSRSRCATISVPAICCRSIAARAAACCALSPARAERSTSASATKA